MSIFSIDIKQGIHLCEKQYEFLFFDIVTITGLGYPLHIVVKCCRIYDDYLIQIFSGGKIFECIFFPDQRSSESISRSTSIGFSNIIVDMDKSSAQCRYIQGIHDQRIFKTRKCEINKSITGFYKRSSICICFVVCMDGTSPITGNFVSRITRTEFIEQDIERSLKQRSEIRK